MRVVKDTREGEPWSKEFTCSGCRSIVLVDENDIHKCVQSYGGDQRESYITYGYGWTCPVCKTANDADTVPADALIRARLSGKKPKDLEANGRD